MHVGRVSKGEGGVKADSWDSGLGCGIYGGATAPEVGTDCAGVNLGKEMVGLVWDMPPSKGLCHIQVQMASW